MIAADSSGRKTGQLVHSDPAALEALAAEFIARRSEGEDVELGPFVAQVADENGRAELKKLIADGMAVERTLPTHLGPGSYLGRRYRILRSIGAGGMGRVFAAFDLELEREIAIKVLPPLEVGDATRESMLARESRMLASLQHPGIVAVHEIGRESELLYIAMDLVDGRALSEVLARIRSSLSERGEKHPRGGEDLRAAIGGSLAQGRADLIDSRSHYRSAAAIVLEVARTLEAAHAKGIIHRDLKPGNVMLIAGGHPVVLDFGLAGHVDLREGDVTTNLYGSVAYLAPEQARSLQCGADPRTDIYQIGLILYELLTLQRAFSGGAIAEVLDNIRQGLFSLPRRRNPNVPIELEAICLKAMEVDPKKRYPSARALREDLERYLAGLEPPHALRFNSLRTFSTRARYLTRRHPVATLVVLFLALLPLLTDWLTWSAPAIEAVRFVDDGKLDYEFNSLSPFDEVGVVVDGGDATVLYALSKFELDLGGERRSYVNPLPLGEGEEWGRSLAPGYVVVRCMNADPLDGYSSERLIIYACARREPVIEQWMTAMDMASKNHFVGGPGLSWAEARILFKDLVPEERGGDLTERQREDIVRKLPDATPDQMFGDSVWTLPRSRRFQFAWQVTP